MLSRSLAVLAVLAIASTALAEDRVAKLDGSEPRGEIISIDRNNVTIKVTQGRDTEEVKIPVTQIERVRFDSEPLELDTARRAALRGQTNDALTEFERITPDSFSGTRAEFMKQDLQYYKAYCLAQLALTGEKPMNEATEALGAFVGKFENSHHLVNAARLLGDLYVAQGKYDEAQQAYAKLTSSTLADVQAQGHVQRGYALLQQNNVQQAQAAFQSAAGTVSDNPQVAKSVQLAKLGLAACKAEQNNAQAAVTDVRQLISGTDEDPEVFARAYNTLGRAHRKANNPQEALLAYLHVDVLYGTEAQQHAEALYYLSTLWSTVGQDERAAEAQALLKDRYANSTWAKQAGS